MDEKLRILLLSQYFHPEVGATQTRIWEFARHLAARGHDVTVVSEFPNHPHGKIPESYRGKWFEEERLDGFDVLRVPVWTSEKKTFLTRLFFYASFAITSVLLAALRLRGRFDVVFATSPPLPVGAAGWLLARIKRARFVLDVRDLWPEAARSLGELSNPRLIRLASALADFLYRHADATTTVTRGFLHHIEERAGTGRVHLVTNGTVPEIFDPNRRDPTLRARLGLEGRFVCTFAGTMGIAQGLTHLADVAGELRDDPRIAFLFIGTGPVRKQLEERVAECRLDNVVFHDQVPLHEITPFLNASDVLLVPLKNDPVFQTFVPSKMFDCLACEKPVVLGVPGEARALLEESGGGLYAEPENPREWASAIRRLARSPTEVESMGRRGRAWVLERYTRSAQAGVLEEILRTTRRSLDVRSEESTGGKPSVLVYGPLPAPYGGARVSFSLFFEYLKRQEKTEIVHVDVPVRAAREANPPGPVQPGPTLRAILQSLPQLRRADRVVLFCSPGSMCSWGLAVAAIARGLRIPTSLRFFGGAPLAPLEQAGTLRRWLTRILLRETDRIVVQTDAGQRQVKGFVGKPARKIGGYRQRTREAGHDSESPAIPRFVFLGRVDETKGIDVLVQAWQRALRRTPWSDTWRLEIFGACSDAWRRRLEPIPGIRYRGIAPHDEIFAALDGARALVLPTRYAEEGHAGVIIEALLAGVPVISTTLDGPAELVQSGQNGLLVDTDDVEALSRAIERVATDDATWQRLAAGARESSPQYDANVALPQLADALGIAGTEAAAR